MTTSDNSNKPTGAGARVPARRVKVGLVAGGLGAYWPQFPDLLPQLQAIGPGASRERITGDRRRRQSTSASSPTRRRARRPPRRSAPGRLRPDRRLPHHLHDRLACSRRSPSGPGAPVLLINLQPTESMDHATFDTGQWLAYCGACPLPEMANAFRALGVPFRSVSGYLEDERAWARIGRWIKAAGVRARAAPRPARADGPPVPRHARRLHRPHPGHRQLRRPRRGAGVRRPAGPGRRGHRRGRTPTGSTLAREVFELDDTVAGRGPPLGRPRLGRPRPAGRRLRPRQPRLLPPGPGRRAARAARRRHDPRRVAAHRPRHPGRRRVRAAHLAGHADRRPARRRRLLHRAPGAQLHATASSRWATTARPTWRSATASRCCAASASTTASAAGACRSSSTCRHGPVTARRPRPAARRHATASSRRPGRGRRRPAAADRQHHVPGRLRPRPRRVDRRLERDRDRATTGRWPPATCCPNCAPPRTCSAPPSLKSNGSVVLDAGPQ